MNSLGKNVHQTSPGHQQTFVQRILHSRELLLMWTLRDVKVRYKQSLVGIGWAILQPLSLMLIFTFVFSFIVKVPTGDIPYPLFSYTAVLPWTFFATAISLGVSSLVNNMNLVTKVHMPRKILPIAAVLASMVDFAIGAIILFCMFLFYQEQIYLTALFVFPLLGIQVVLTVGVVLLGSSLNVLYRDIRFLIPLAIQLWMYASPIIYPVQLIPERLQSIYFLNPMAGIIQGYRLSLLDGQQPDFRNTGLALIVSAVIFFLGNLTFNRLEPEFADLI